MYLLDDSIGCVFIIHPFYRVDLAKTFIDKKGENLVYHRENVPYEKFFKCPADYSMPSSLDADRCNTTSESSQLDPADGDEKTDIDWVSFG